MPHVDLKKRFKQLNIEVELGFTLDQTVKEVERCLNCDIQTVFAANLCIECDACIDVCPVDCLTITENGDEDDLRTRLTAPAENLEEDLYVSEPLLKPRGLWLRMKIFASIAVSVLKDAQQVHGICRNQQSCLPHVKDELEASRLKKASSNS